MLRHTPEYTMSASEYTVSGTSEVDAKIETILSDVRGVISREVEASRICALVLIGGYGRGEGGVELRDGEEHPHNNLDLLLISRGSGPGRKAPEKDRLSLALEPLRTRHGVGIDIGVVSDTALRTSPNLVMWHDMRFAHRTVLGDSQFVPSLTRFTVEGIPSWDICNLLVNRGTLLVINDLLLEAGTWSTTTARTVIRHAMKAIIGYGDALLYFNGRYHWSYVEKQSRMRKLSAAPSDFRQLYDTAIEFRFRPDYARYRDCHLPQWLESLNPILAGIHLTCERTRLRSPALRWERYLDAALTQILREDLTSPRRLARKMTNVARRPIVGFDVSALASLGARAAGPRGLLPILFPAVAYRAVTPVLTQALEGFCEEPCAMRRMYLELWGQHVDVNFNLPPSRPIEPVKATREAA
jgi:hypothetical protein